MEIFVWWEAPISMRVEWRCVSTISGEQCVITPGILLMLLWSANSWDMHTLEVRLSVLSIGLSTSSPVPQYIGGRAYSNAHFGAGSGPIFLDDLQCTSSSNQLLGCTSSPILSHNCLHTDDAGVGCEGMFSGMILYYLQKYNCRDGRFRMLGTL